MIPGTLRPLPKRLAKVKTEAERLFRAVDYDYETIKEILKSSKNFEFEEIRRQYINCINHHIRIVPLVKEADKLLVKYSRDPLLKEMVFKLFDKLEKYEYRLNGDIQRLDTILMSKRKEYINKTIPLVKSEIRSKLSFLRDLDFEQLLADSEKYSAIISGIVDRVNILKDEYQKLIENALESAVEAYKELKEKLDELEDELKEYVLILATCKMELLINDSKTLLEEGVKIFERFELEQTTELIEEAQEYLEKAKPTLKEMNELKVDIPKKAMKKSFETKFRELRNKFEENKFTLDELINNIETRNRLLSTNIERIDALKELAKSMSSDIKETGEILKIKRMGTFKLYLKENLIPHMELQENGIVKIPKAEELTATFIDEIILTLEDVDNKNIVKDWFNAFRATKVGKWIYETSIKIKNKIVDITKKIVKKTKKWIQEMKEKREQKKSQENQQKEEKK
ncbi:MAG: hypothetical protein K9W45_01580 [Candidatus Heimdallarchaeum aukensis]|uniref:Uncharacterized protein n=1 Tax=Candidatus Heimdallarchaeum aukensis TaxID=2876573 RepID=A0A9Y1BLQ0_9ARCH|nr:MAG: hypothetical protein K9W45_01560 [Candidatus Heimdallarchaeum aukensis]UJG41167.1 MAG: hypothetical protein K9W45_01580 [Candidatus Heimdallarchaeum aukensis]